MDKKKIEEVDAIAQSIFEDRKKAIDMGLKNLGIEPCEEIYKKCHRTIYGPLQEVVTLDGEVVAVFDVFEISIAKEKPSVPGWLDEIEKAVK